MVADILMQRRWARISRQYIAEYWKGADACDAMKAVVKMRNNNRHRDVGNGNVKAMRHRCEMAATAAMNG